MDSEGMSGLSIMVMATFNDLDILNPVIADDIGLGMHVDSLNSLLNRAIEGLAKFRDRRWERQGIEDDRHDGFRTGFGTGFRGWIW
jgi:hypothetical protein